MVKNARLDEDGVRSMLATRRISIRTKLVLTYLAVTLPLIAILGVTLYAQYQGQRNAAINERIEIARLAASNFNLFVDRTLHTEIIAGETIIDQKLSTVQASDLLFRIAREETPMGITEGHASTISNAVFMDANGVVIAAAIPETIGQDRANRPAVKAILQGSESAIGNLQRNADGAPGFVIAAAIRRGGTLEGIVSVSINAERLGDVLGIEIARGGVNIVDSTGHLIFQSQAQNIPISKRDWSDEPFVKKALAGEIFTSTGLTFPLDGSFRMGAELPMRNIGWAVGSFLPVDLVLAPIRRDAIFSALLTIAVLLGALFLAIAFANGLINGLIILSNRMQAAPQSHFKDRVTIRTGDEIEDLANSFNQMQDEIVSAQNTQEKLQEELRERNTELADLYEAQKNVSSILQESLLPKISQQVDGLEIGIRFQSATEAALIGGDFYDFFEISGNRFGVVMGDVSGKGIGAAALAATIRNIIRVFAYESDSPASVIKKVNQIAVIETEPAIFVTLFFGIFDCGIHKLTYSSAGHWPPIMYDLFEGQFEELEHDGLALGIDERATFNERTKELTHESLITLFTDGVIESRSDGDFFGTDGLEQSILKYLGLPPADIANNIIEDAKNFSGGKLLDDAAVMVIKALAATSSDTEC